MSTIRDDINSSLDSILKGSGIDDNPIHRQYILIGMRDRMKDKYFKQVSARVIKGLYLREIKKMIKELNEIILK